MASRLSGGGEVAARVVGAELRHQASGFEVGEEAEHFHPAALGDATQRFHNLLLAVGQLRAHRLSLLWGAGRRQPDGATVAAGPSGRRPCQVGDRSWQSGQRASERAVWLPGAVAGREFARLSRAQGVAHGRAGRASACGADGEPRGHLPTGAGGVTCQISLPRWQMTFAAQLPSGQAVAS
jgi:hypothetical protein